MFVARATICAIVAPILALTLGFPTPLSAQDFEKIDRPLGSRSSSADISWPGTSATRELDCSSALAIGVGEQVAGSTVGLVAQQDVYGCGNEPETGPELVYLLELTEPTRFEVTVESDADLDVILLDGCDPDLDCLALGDVGVRSLRPVVGSYYIVVDGYAGAEDDFVLRVTELTEMEIPEHFCTPVALKQEYRQFEWDDTTCASTSEIDALLCSYSVTAGRESETNKFGIEAGGMIRATVTPTDADLAIYLIGSCGVNSQCLAFADQGFAGAEEILEWVNPGPFGQTVYLVVDTVGAPDDCGDYHISVEFDAIVPNGENSWSTLKSWFSDEAGGAR